MTSEKRPEDEVPPPAPPEDEDEAKKLEDPESTEPEDASA